VLTNDSTLMGIAFTACGRPPAHGAVDAAMAMPFNYRLGERISNPVSTLYLSGHGWKRDERSGHGAITITT